MNTQHNCHRYGCGATGSRQVYQERTLTQSTSSIVEHLQNPADQILNTAQMRDALYVQKHRINSTQLNPDTLIQEAAAKAIDARKLASAASALIDSSSRGRGRGRGSGRARGTMQLQVLSQARGRAQIQSPLR